MAKTIVEVAIPLKFDKGALRDALASADLDAPGWSTTIPAIVQVKADGSCSLLLSESILNDFASNLSNWIETYCGQPVTVTKT